MYKEIPRPINNTKDITTIFVSFARCQIFSKEIFELAIRDFHKNYMHYNELDLASMYYAVGSLQKFSYQYNCIENYGDDFKLDQYTRGKWEEICEKMVFSKQIFLSEKLLQIDKASFKGNFTSILMGIINIGVKDYDKIQNIYDPIFTRLYNDKNLESSL